MRARNNTERQVVAWANSMSPATQHQKEWAFDKLFRRVAKYYKKGYARCLNCGTIWNIGTVVGVGVCPHCGKRVKMEYWKESKTPENEGAVFSILTTSHRWQVFRVFEAIRRNRRGEPTKRDFNELFQIWLSPEGREVIASRPYSRSYYYLRWDYDAPFEIKKRYTYGGGYYYYYDLFSLSDMPFYPHYGILSILRRNGWSTSLLKYKSVDSSLAARYLLNCNDAEMMVKAGQVSMFLRMIRRRETKAPHRCSINICNRNGYIIENADMWVDYIDLLEHFNLDTHNAHYVCPQNLQEAHDKLMRKKRIEEAKKRALLFEPQYIEKRGRFFGVTISDGEITCHVLRSILEFIEEGDAMHHCVYTNEYYDLNRHPDSLIMSARDKSGKRLETVEINLNTLKVVQSEGVCNKPTPMHKRIVELVNKNIQSIIARK